MFAARSINAAVLRTLGLHERSPEQETFHPEFFSTLGTHMAMPLPKPDYKQAKGLRAHSKLTHIVCHITGVTGGFGISKRQKRKWENTLDICLGHANSTGSLSLDWQLEAAGVWEDKLRGRSSSPMYQLLSDPQLLAPRLALWERYRRTPYHQIASQNGDVLANRSLGKRTYHAGAGNGGAGFAVDCGPNEELSEQLVTTGKHGLWMLGLRMKLAGAEPPFILVPHRVYQYPGRARDTGRNVWRHIIKPTALRHPKLFRIGYEVTHPKGRPIPLSWDIDAHYTSNGKPR